MCIRDRYYIIKPKKALASLKKLLREAPQKAKPEDHSYIAMVYYDRKELKEARREFEEIIRLYPDSPLSFVAKEYIKKIQEESEGTD